MATRRGDAAMGMIRILWVELQISFERAVENGGEQGVQFGGDLGLQAL